MKSLVENFILLLAIFISIIFIHRAATASSKIEINLLKGTASLITKASQISLSSGDLIGTEDMIQTGPDAKVEIMFPDGSYLRFDEHTIFKLKAISVDSKDGTRHIHISLILGKIWAGVSPSFSGQGAFTVSTKTALAESVGAVYRVNASKDNITQIKVYSGEAKVINQTFLNAVKKYRNKACYRHRSGFRVASSIC